MIGLLTFSISLLLLCGRYRWVPKANQSVLTYSPDIDTVERNILDLAARQGLSLYTKENSAGTLNVSSLGMDSETKTVDSPVKKKVEKGDFIFKSVNFASYVSHELIRALI